MELIILTNIFQSLIDSPFYRYAFIAGICVGVLAPLIGTVVVIRRLSFIADTLSHFSLAGVAVGVFLAKIIPPSWFGLDPILMGVVFSVAGTFIIEKLRGFYKNYKELSMPILLSFGVALSGLFIYLTPGISTNWTTGLLFGSIYSINARDIILILSLSVIVITLSIIFYKKIVSLCFDEVYAQVSGINIRLFQLAITIILSLVISIFLDLVGVLLISSLMIVPVAAAILVGDSFKNTIVSAIIFSEISVIGGFTLSYYLNLPTGSTIVLINILILLIIMGISRIRKIKFKKDDDYLTPE
ncbi:MAG TPA: metal ABC transporter permease [Bacilli bacterium]|nr:MAG: High-affinity zinc uptake system membrane protein ZnuB [Tenericutes bacterium ADurb.BinA124]HNZ50137.1 metal ABC transporter permease [Bacilli bacterium]HOH17918.1 metal ABC transporter permease [Bacilli bacterium]HPN60649.1 metal ABC transporter permease [Bacilli bacterium]HPX84045.1 metal ABC transporter permease [Bacilli bacterium]